MADTGGGQGQQQPSDAASQYNNIEFIVQQILGRVNTTKLVKVKKIYSSNAVAAVGFVDVQPMVNMLDGIGGSTSHGTINKIPYTRIQGGKNAVIMDPKVDDIGWMACCDRDISGVKESKDLANPNSYREFNFADGVYIGGLLNGIPDNYIQFTDDDKINIVAKSDVSVTTQGKAKITSTGDVQVVSSGGDINLTAHNVIHLVAPTIKLSGSIVFDGNASSITGTFNFNGNMIVNGSFSGTSVNQGSINLLSHHHAGPVVSGSVVTGGALA